MAALPKDLQELYTKATGYEEEKKYIQALRLYSKLCDYNDSASRFASIIQTGGQSFNTNDWISAGNLYFEKYRFLDAIKCYQKAYRLSPCNTNLMFNMALAYERLSIYQYATQRKYWLVLAALYDHPKSINKLAKLYPEKSIEQLAAGIVADTTCTKLAAYKQISWLTGLERLVHSSETTTPAILSCFLSDAIKYGDDERAKQLIAMGADCNSMTSDGYTPLHLAVMKNNVTIGRLLLEHGANPMLKNWDNKMPVELDTPGTAFLHAIASENIAMAGLVHNTIIQVQAFDPALTRALENLKIFMSLQLFHPLADTGKKFKNLYPQEAETILHYCQNADIVQLLFPARPSLCFQGHASLLRPSITFFHLPPPVPSAVSQSVTSEPAL